MSPRGCSPPRIVVATRNPGKLAEIREILASLPVRISGLPEGSTLRFAEEGASYAENARAKARAVAVQLGEWAVADDSGLEVDALSGAPGPLSARYGGPGLDDAARVERLLGALADTPPALRGARFVCAAALATPGGDGCFSWGECRGKLLSEPSGQGGFGYDPIFQPEGREESMAELSCAEKNRLSHRARAFRELGRELMRRIRDEDAGSSRAASSTDDQAARQTEETVADRRNR